MLKIMKELSSTYEYFQRAHTLTHAHTAQHIRCKHAPLLCTMHKHTTSCWCHDMTFETHMDNAFKCKRNGYCTQIKGRCYLSHI